MRHKRLLVSEDVIAEIQVSLDKLELDLQRHNMGRDIADRKSVCRERV